MTKEKMSITRALVEKKRISERIDRDIRNLKNPIQLTIGDSIVGGFSSNEEFEDDIKKQFQSIMSNIKRRNAIVAAIAKANATEYIEINNEKMTIGQALERKKSLNNINIKLQSSLKDSYNNFIVSHNRKTEEIQNKMENSINTLIGKDKKVTEDEVKAIRQLIENKFKINIHDPLNIKELIEKQEEEIKSFMDDIDAIIVEKNSTTIIEFEY